MFVRVFPRCSVISQAIAFNLRLGIILRLQSTHGRLDQSTQNGNIFRNSEAEVDVRLHHR